VASSDTNPSTGAQTLGTLYALSASGSLLWRAPHRGAPLGAVLLAANPGSQQLL
jgi:hypothetical protein